jgi:hypothetical protein
MNSPYINSQPRPTERIVPDSDVVVHPAKLIITLQQKGGL